MAGSGETLTHGELETGSARLARWLVEHGMRPGDVDRVARRQLPAGVRGLLGLAALRPAAHRGQPPPHRGRGRLHRPRLRGEGAGRRRVAGPARGGGRRGGARGRAAAGLRRGRAGLRRLRRGAGRRVRRAAGRGARGRGDAVLVGHHRTPEGRPAADAAAADRRARRHATSRSFGGLYGFTPETVYLSPAPLYHAAPLRFTATVQALGGTVDRHGPVRRRGGAGRDRASTGRRTASGCRRCSCGCSSWRPRSAPATTSPRCGWRSTRPRRARST